MIIIGSHQCFGESLLARPVDEGCGDRRWMVRTAGMPMLCFSWERGLDGKDGQDAEDVFLMEDAVGWVGCL